MKNIKIKFSLFSLFIFFTTMLFSQDVIEKASENDDESYISLDLNYISDAVFMGRKDSIAAPYLYPSILYHHKSGLYGKGSFSYLTKNDQNRIDLYLFTVGMDYNTSKFYVDISASKYFFNDDSYNIISQVETDISASLKYDFNVFNISLMASNYFSNNNTSDFFLSTELSHDFVSSNNKFQFSPSIGVHFGSQNFYEAYYVYKQTQNTGSGSGNGNGKGNSSAKDNNSEKDEFSLNNDIISSSELAINESEKFKVMAIDFKFPFWYIHKSITYSLMPILSIPQSENTVVSDTVIEKENIKSTFYFIAGISYKFN